MGTLKRSVPSLRNRSGITLIEVCVTIGIVGMLLSMIIPAIASSRRAAVKTQCISRMRQIGQAIHAFESTQNGLPHFYFHNQLLAYIEQPRLAELTDLNYDITKEEVALVNSTVIPLYQCPSDPAPEAIDVSLLDSGFSHPTIQAGFNYAPNSNWMIRDFPKKRLQSNTLVNGAANAVLISEILRPDAGFQRLRTVWQVPGDPTMGEGAFRQACNNLPYDPYAAGYRPHGYRGAPWSGMPTLNFLVYNHGLPPNRPNCDSVPGRWHVYPAMSAHSGGVQALYADGHVDFINESIDIAVWEQAGVLSRDEVW